MHAVKSKVWADFLAEHWCVEIEDVVFEMNNYIGLQPCVLMFNGSYTRDDTRVGINVTDP